MCGVGVVGVEFVSLVKSGVSRWFCSVCLLCRNSCM